MYQAPRRRKANSSIQRAISAEATQERELAFVEYVEAVEVQELFWARAVEALMPECCTTPYLGCMPRCMSSFMLHGIPVIKAEIINWAHALPMALRSAQHGHAILPPRDFGILHKLVSSAYAFDSISGRARDPHYDAHGTRHRCTNSHTTPKM